MAKITLTDITAGYDTTTIYGANNTLIEAAIENTLSRDGTGPNQMEAGLDMNSYAITNLPNAVNNQSPLTLAQAASLASVTTSLSQENVGAVLYPITAAETSAAVTPTNYYYPPGDLRRYGAVGDDATDNATAIQAAIDVAEVSGGEVYVPEGDFRFETGLTNTANITIRGAAVEQSVLKKVGNIDGITVTGNPSSIFTRFALDATGDTTGVGLKIKSGGRGRYTELLIQNQGSHGIHIGTATAGESNNLSSFRDIKTLTNGGDGIKIEGEAVPNANAMVFLGIDTRGNTGWGLNIDAGWSNMGNIVAQNNTGGGVRFNNARRNVMTLYTESSTGDEVDLVSSTTYGNILTLMGTASTGLVDNTGLGVDANYILTTKHQAEFEPKIRSVSTDQLSLTSQQFDGTDSIGRLDITHPSARRYDWTASGTAADQDIYLVNSDGSGNLNLRLDGKFGAYGVTPPAQASHIADPTGGATTDAEARTAINAILVVLENLGFTATS